MNPIENNIMKTQDHTAHYPLDLKKTFELMNEALAGEICCVLRYRHHQVIAKGIHSTAVAAEFAEHAESEADHMMKIAERIDLLGGDPEFNPSVIATLSPTEYGSKAGAPLQQLIRENIAAEQIAIDNYKRLIAYFGAADPTSRRLFEDLLADEEEHFHDLSTMIAQDSADKPH